MNPIALVRDRQGQPAVPMNTGSRARGGLPPEVRHVAAGQWANPAARHLSQVRSDCLVG
jgi:hypothetical protein